mmetsp:Transcript_57627/g.122560  ORF Transcript_57627/g.122560 Transcript_57627/m.122560 type:complete len:489 (-) Transcript_57627:120-1586(-)|eukprot:CAMPEP_0206456848 /NCGR_PEP_ID=MMETSP0324_2-20121206/22610_1 /ASSEMBLY_ACC=CAM_ASM_000836 /TAXON_ID=2866 /ORGANISM="Crypthecodinium cohnii, Strain Seligo" /LENGTH=488 /DNA_ID=CAMNT_0053927857 /DNA_START=57 /DNA_END=1523 /DNA_ORIENTATION=+
MPLSASASAPQLARAGSSGSSSSLKAGASAMGLNAASSAAYLTTNLYDKMSKEGLFRDHVAPAVRPAGRSITVPLADSTERDLQPEVYFPLPPTPNTQKKFRRLSETPGQMTIHHGLKDQTLPPSDFRYGIRGQKGVSTEDAMKAGQLMGVAEYKNSVRERVYETVRKEPLGKPYCRGHTLKMLPEGYGNPSGVPEDAKAIINHKYLGPESQADRNLYKRTHKSFEPGERFSRNYIWPAEAQEKSFKFGAGLASAVEGAGSRLALNLELDEDGNYKRTKLVTKVNEDFRHVQEPKVGEKTHPKQGAAGPPLGTDHRYGIKSSISEYTAQSCIKGYYALEDQLPDYDLGRCTKVGKRNITKETRAFGVPSIRNDIPAPHPSKRSIADDCSYGDEPSAAVILSPQRFDTLGISDSEFLLRRPKEEIEALLKSVPLPGCNFDELWEKSVALFADGLQLVSLDVLLYVHSENINTNVAMQTCSLQQTVKPVA